MDHRSTCLHSSVVTGAFFTCVVIILVDQVARPGHKKARMARTRSDFLTRGSNPPGEGESEEEEYDETPLSLGPPLPKQDSEGGTLDACHSDSEMVIKRSPKQALLRRQTRQRGFSLQLTYRISLTSVLTT